MLHLLAWLFLTWKSVKEVIIYVTSDHGYTDQVGSKHICTEEHSMRNELHIENKPLDNEVKSFHGVKQRSSTTQKQSSSNLDKQGFDSVSTLDEVEVDQVSLENLLVAASWRAVNDDPDEGQYYNTALPKQEKRQVIQEENFMVASAEMPVESSTPDGDDVFTTELASEEDIFYDTRSKQMTEFNDDAMSFEDSSRRMKEACHAKNTKIITSGQERVDVFAKSVSVNVSEPRPVYFTPDRTNSVSDDSGCVSDLLTSPKQYKSSLHTTLHSPYGSLENVSQVSYEIDVKKQKTHQRVDSWDALNVDKGNAMSSLSRQLRDETTKMTVTVRPKSVDCSSYGFSPTRLTIHQGSPTVEDGFTLSAQRSSKEEHQDTLNPNASTVSVDARRHESHVITDGQKGRLTSKFDSQLSNTLSQTLMQGKELQTGEGLQGVVGDIQVESVCTSDFIGTEGAINVALIQQQGSQQFSIASQSPVSEKKKNRRTIDDDIFATKDGGGVHVVADAMPNNPLAKVGRRPTFDSETHTQIETFYEDLNQGMEFGSPPSANYRDFDEIMRKRRRQVDVVDQAGLLFGTLGNRDDKLSGEVISRARRNWKKVKYAVRSGRFQSIHAEQKPKSQVSRKEP